VVEREPDLILVVDASEDQLYSCSDLGSTIQRVRSDLHARIDLDLDSYHSSERPHQGHSALGTVQYRSGKKALIAYIKPVITGDEPAEVLSYRSLQPAFPQQRTAQQLFDEWQFESYRMLGLHSIDSACGEVIEALVDHPIPVAAKLREQFQKARKLRAAAAPKS